MTHRPPSNRPHSYGLVIAILALGLSVTACENSVDPIHETGFEAFAIHGYLDMRTSRQEVRIESLRPTVLAEPISMDGVQVSTIESETGLFHIWSDSTVVLDTGEPATVYAADFTPELGKTYRLIVSRNGENGAEAVAKVPSKPNVFTHTPVGNTLTMKQHIVLQGMKDPPDRVHISYVVLPSDDSGEQTVRIAYGQPGAATAEGWEFDVDLARDRNIILNQLSLNIPTHTVTIRNVSFEMTVYSEEWKEPQKEANLDHAHGFFGSVGVVKHPWIIDTTSLNTLGFIDGQKRN